MSHSVSKVMVRLNEIFMEDVGSPVGEGVVSGGKDLWRLFGVKLQDNLN